MKLKKMVLQGRRISQEATKKIVNRILLHVVHNYLKDFIPILVSYGVAKERAPDCILDLYHYLETKGLTVTPAAQSGREKEGEPALPPAAQPASPPPGTADDSVAPPLPTVAPAKWSDLKDRRGMNPAEFVRHYYAPWLGKGLERAHLGPLDRPLHAALKTWLSRHPNEALDLPVKREVTDERARLAFSTVEETSVALPQSEEEREEILRRVGTTLAKRKQRSGATKER